MSVHIGSDIVIGRRRGVGVLGGGGVAGRYDNTPSVIVECSLSRVNSSYSGPLVKILRNSDDATQDFGYLANGDLDVASITSWLAGSSGFVHTLYGQSDNINAVQTTKSKMPQFVASGLNGKPCMRFDGVDDVLTGDYAQSSYAASAMVVAKTNNHVNFARILVFVSATNNPHSIALGGSFGSVAVAGKTTAQQPRVVADDMFHIFTGLFTAENSIVFRNDSAIPSQLGATTTLIQGNVPDQKFSIGARQDQSFWAGDLAEFVIANAVWSGAEYQAIEVAAASYWGVTGIDPSPWTDYANNPVHNKGLGSVLKIDDTYYLYADDEWNGTSIVYATSADGFTWTHQGTALSVGADGAWDDNHIGVPYVFKDGSTYYMTYRGDNGDGVRKGGIASSPDGITWTKSANNPYLTDNAAWVTGGGGVEPWGVIKVGSTYYQYYSAFGGLVRRVGLMTTTSTPDNWATGVFTKDAANPIFLDYYRCMDVFRRGSYYYAIPTYRDIDTPNSFYLFRDTSPTFYQNSRELIKIPLRSGGQSWHSFFVDVAFVMTGDVHKDLSSDSELRIYYAGETGGEVYETGLVRLTDIDAALERTLP